MIFLAELFAEARGWARRLADDRSGISMLEFAFIGPIFFAILMAIFETGFMFVSALVIEGATAQAARQIRTGQVQQSGDQLGAFRQILCNNLFGIVDCADLRINVQNFDPGNIRPNPAEVFEPGAAGRFVIVQVRFEWEFVTPFLNIIVGQGAPNSRRFIASAAFHNEPF